MTETDAAAPAVSPPLPQVNDRNRFYWDAVQAHELQLLRCQACGHYVHYPRPICDRCQSWDLAPEQISGRATLYSFCVVMQASHPWFADKIPYIIGVVEVDEEPGVLMPTGIVDCTEDELRCGIPMEVVFRAVTDDFTLPYFRPAAGR